MVPGLPGIMNVLCTGHVGAGTVEWNWYVVGMLIILCWIYAHNYVRMRMLVHSPVFLS